MTDFEDWMKINFGKEWLYQEYNSHEMLEAYEAGRQSVALDELALKGQLLDEIMAHR